jgi:hypothetical protein
MPTDKETAMAEVRPWIGSKVSAAATSNADPLIDFSQVLTAKLTYIEEPLPRSGKVYGAS